MILPNFHESSPTLFALLTMSPCRWDIIHELFDLCNHLDGDGWVCFDNWLDDLCYDVFFELPMILSEHWRETSVMTSDTLDNLFIMPL